MDTSQDPQYSPLIDELRKKIQDITDTVRMHIHSGFDLTQRLDRTQLSRIQMVNEGVLGDGVNNPGKLLLQIADGKGDTEIRAGIATGDFANAGNANGFIFGIDDSDSNKVKFYWGGPSNNISFNGTTLVITGSVSVGSLDIPDVTTANSFHTDTSGNSWWGANVATGYAGANAAILATGAATFKSLQIGGATLQYGITDSGGLNYGDGSDGVANFDGTNTFSFASKSGSNYTLTKDMYGTVVTIATGVTLNPAGYRIFASTSLTLNGTGKIFRNGNAGTNGADGGGGAGGLGGAGASALADGYLKGSPAGKTGGNGGGNGQGTTGGTNGADTSNSIGSNGVGGGSGGGTSNASAGGTATASNVKLIANWHLATLLDIGSTGATVKFDNSAGSGSGGGGGGNGANRGGGGGGSGGSGGIIAIYAKTITVGASASITANGGIGGNGGAADSTADGGGGGGGGNGGQLILVYNSYTNNGTVTVSGGSKGTGSGTGSNGVDGAAGNIRLFQLSL